MIPQVQGVMQERPSRLEEIAKTVHPLHQVAHQYVMQIEILDMLHCATVMLVIFIETFKVFQ